MQLRHEQVSGMHTRLGRCLALSVCCHVLLLWPPTLPKLVSPPALRVSFAAPLPLTAGATPVRTPLAAVGAVSPVRTAPERRVDAGMSERQAELRESVRTAMPESVTVSAERLRSYRLAIARLFAALDAPVTQQALQVRLVLRWPQAGTPRVVVAQSSGDAAFDDWAQHSLGLAVQRQGAPLGGETADFELDFVIEAGASSPEHGSGG